jgi:acyl dehydratase
LDQDELRFVYEKELLALPTMALSMCSPHGWVRKSGTGFGNKSVTSWQSLRLHALVPVSGRFVSKARVVSVIDKGRDRGAIVTATRDLYEADTGLHIATMEWQTFCRGDGGFGGPAGPARAPHALPDSVAQFTLDVRTLPQAALIYRLGGDYNPLHADPQHARAVGFRRPNLHGLCTMAIAGCAILKVLCGWNPGRLRALEARFSKPVYPGDTLRTEMWVSGTIVSFRTLVPERDGEVVIDGGRAELAPAQT